MARLVRVDAELVRRSLARSREHARELLEAGRVTVDGATVTKAARQVDPAQAIEVGDADRDGYVSRGAHKLVGALDALAARGTPIAVAGRRCLDAGASTGGFTDVLLRRGAAHVVAVDVGYGQLAWSLRSDPRVTAVERTNVRTLDPGTVAPPPDLVVGDLSFISLALVIPALAAAAARDADFLLMVKPQFEVGRERLGRGGVVRDAESRTGAILDVVASAASAGLATRAIVPSPLPGPAGNVEYFVAMRRSTDGALTGAVLRAQAEAAVAGGPQEGLSA